MFTVEVNITDFIRQQLPLPLPIVKYRIEKRLVSVKMRLYRDTGTRCICQSDMRLIRQE